jgi:hypothetical protein
MLLLEAVTTSVDKRSVWIRYGLVSLLGLYASYSFVLVVAAQLAFLFLFARVWRMTLLYTIALGLLCLPLAYLFFQSVPTVSSIHAGVESDLAAFLQVLVAATPMGFVFFGGQLMVAMGLSLVVVSAATDRRNYHRPFVYCLLQVLTPFILFWCVLTPFLNIPLPLAESRQFIVVLPALYILVSYGFQTWRRIHYPVFITILTVSLFCLVALASYVSLARYWNQGKSPEGQAVLTLRQQVRPEDAVVSLHHSLDAALSFYLPDLEVFTRPVLAESGFLFSHSTVLDQSPAFSPDAEAFAHKRIWLLVDRRRSSAVEETFVSHCQVTERQIFQPFEKLLLEECA